jgi:hypothetical protein
MSDPTPKDLVKLAYEKTAAPVTRFPVRIYGPLPAHEATSITVRVMEDETGTLTDTLNRFGMGDIDTYQLAYEIQAILDSERERIENALKYPDEDAIAVLYSSYEGEEHA